MEAFNSIKILCGAVAPHKIFYRPPHFRFLISVFFFARYTRYSRFPISFPKEKLPATFSHFLRVSL